MEISSDSYGWHLHLLPIAERSATTFDAETDSPMAIASENPDFSDNDRQQNFLLATYKYTSDERNAILRRMDTGFSNEEWGRLSHFAQCDDSALRFELNKLHRFYWHHRIDEWIPTSIGDTVQALLKRTQHLKRDLKKISNDPNFYKGVFLEHNRSPMKYADELEQSFRQLAHLESVLYDAQSRLDDTDSQPTYGPVTGAMRNVDLVAHQYYSAGISGSKTKPFGLNFIIELFGLLDVKVKPSYIETLLKEYLLRRKNWGGIDQIARQLPR